MRSQANPASAKSVDQTSIVLWLMVLLVFVPLTTIHIAARIAPAEQPADARQAEPAKRPPGSRAE